MGGFDSLLFANINEAAHDFSGLSDRDLIHFIFLFEVKKLIIKIQL
jgi:hypothetical protein